MRSQKLTTWIFIAMIAGIIVGYMCNQMIPDAKAAKTVAGYISLFTDIFLRLIKMIIAPLVFSTLVVGIAHLGDTKSVGRIGLQDDRLVPQRVAGVAAARPGAGQHPAAGRGPQPAAAGRGRVDQPQDGDRSRSRSSSRTWCRGASSRRWPRTRSCRSSCSRSSSALPRRASGEKAKTIVAWVEDLVAHHAEDHRLRDDVRPGRGVRGDGLRSSRRRAWASS